MWNWHCHGCRWVLLLSLLQFDINKVESVVLLRVWGRTLEIFTVNCFVLVLVDQLRWLSAEHLGKRVRLWRCLNVWSIIHSEWCSLAKDRLLGEHFWREPGSTKLSSLSQGQLSLGLWGEELDGMCWLLSLRASWLLLLRWWNRETPWHDGVVIQSQPWDLLASSIALPRIGLPTWGEHALCLHHLPALWWVSYARSWKTEKPTHFAPERVQTLVFGERVQSQLCFLLIDHDKLFEADSLLPTYKELSLEDGYQG